MEIAAQGPYPEQPDRSDTVAGRRIDWTGRDVFAGVCYFIGIFIAGQIATIPFLIAYGDTSRPFFASAFIFGAAVEVAVAVVAASLTFRKYGGGWAQIGFGPVTNSTLLWALGAFIAAFALAGTYGVLVEEFGPHFLKSECAEQIPFEVRDDRALLALASLVVIAFAPVCEELFFRGFLFTGLAKAWGLVPGIVASALLFAGAHLLYKSFLPIALVGMVFAFTYSRSRNILSTMLAHMAFNGLSIAFIAGGSCPQEPSPGAWLGALHGAAAVVASALPSALGR